MHFVFLENSNDFTSSSLNLKAIDSFQRALIHFCKELVRKFNEYPHSDGALVIADDVAGVYCSSTITGVAIA